MDPNRVEPDVFVVAEVKIEEIDDDARNDTDKVDMPKYVEKTDAITGSIGNSEENSRATSSPGIIITDQSTTDPTAHTTSPHLIEMTDEDMEPQVPRFDAESTFLDDRSRRQSEDTEQKLIIEDKSASTSKTTTSSDKPSGSSVRNSRKRTTTTTTEDNAELLDFDAQRLSQQPRHKRHPAVLTGSPDQIPNFIIRQQSEEVEPQATKDNEEPDMMLFFDDNPATREIQPERHGFFNIFHK